MKAKRLGAGGVLRRVAVPATTAAGMAVSDEVAPADVAQGAMGLGSKFLTKLGGGLGMLLHSPGLNEGHDDPNSDFQKARRKAKEDFKAGRLPYPNAKGGAVKGFARGGGIESRGKTKGRFV